MEEIREYKKYKIFGKTIKIQLPELVDPSLNEIKMIVRKPRYLFSILYVINNE
jgi:hypothetical protein